MMDREISRLIAVMDDGVVITAAKGNVIGEIKYLEKPNRLSYERREGSN